MPSLGPAEILVILVVALMVFGPNRLPELARQVGKAVREFRSLQEDLRRQLRETVGDLGIDALSGDTVPRVPPREDATDPQGVVQAPLAEEPPGEQPSAQETHVGDRPEPPPAEQA